MVIKELKIGDKFKFVNLTGKSRMIYQYLGIDKVNEYVNMTIGFRTPVHLYRCMSRKGLIVHRTHKYAKVEPLN